MTVRKDTCRIPSTIRSIVAPDGAVLMDSQSGLMFSLNHVGGAIWKQLQEECSYEQITRYLADEFHISREQAMNDINAFVAELQKHRLLL